jgi:hypothetical protein
MGETKEARVLIRVGSPWITTCCPTCGKSVSSAWKFCSECGQALSFNLFHDIVKIGSPESLTTSSEWVEYSSTGYTREFFLVRLKELEEHCLIKTDPTVKLARDAYIAACFLNFNHEGNN